MNDPSIAEEHFARIIAFWHGQKIVSTVAATMGYDDSGWSWEVDKYVHSHWKDYLSAACAILNTR